LLHFVDMNIKILITLIVSIEEIEQILELKIFFYLIFLSLVRVDFPLHKELNLYRKLKLCRFQP